MHGACWDATPTATKPCYLQGRSSGTENHLEEVARHDLEYADDMALFSDNWLYLTTMLDSLSNCKKKLVAKRQTLAVLPSECSQFQTPDRSTLCQEMTLLKWSLISSTWAALFKMIVDWTQRLILEAAKPHVPSSHSLGSCGINVRSRPVPRFVF